MAYTAARNKVIEKIGISQFHLPSIISKATNIKALTLYINRTGRLKN